MERSVYENLSASLSSDTEVRKNAENQLKHWEATEIEFPLYLAKILAADSCDSPQRQSAGLFLKNYVNKHWSASSEKFEEPLTPSEIKNSVRILAFQTLSCPIVKVRFAAAYLVARLAHFDWPEEWSDFVDLLIQLIQSGDRAGVHGSFRAFAEFAHKDLSDQQVTTIGPKLFPELLKVVSTPDTFSHQTRVHAVEIFHNFVSMIHIVKEVNPSVETELLAPILPLWLDFFSQILAVESFNASVLSMAIEVIISLQKLAQFFPNSLAGKETYFSSLVINFLQKISGDYFKSEVCGEDSSIIDLDGNEGSEELDVQVKYESVIYPAFEFLGSLSSIEQTTGRKTLTHEPHILSSLFWLIISFHQVTSDQVDTWNDDPNLFAVDDDEYSLNYTVRVAAQDLLLILLSAFGSNAISSLSEACSSHIENSTSLRQSGSSSWWFGVESCLSCLGQASLELIENYNQAKSGNLKPLFDFESFFTTIVLPLLSEQEQPLAQGRALIFTSQFGNILPPELALQCLNQSIMAMKGSQSVLVNICGLKSVYNFCRFLSRELLSPCLASIFEATSAIAPQINEDILYILLETWSSAIKINHEITFQCSQMFLPMLMDIWAKNASDHLATEIIRDLIQDLAGNPLIYENLVEHIVPGLIKYISAPESSSLVVSSAIDLLTSLTEGGPSPLPAGYVENTFVSILSASYREDPELHSSLQNFFIGVVSKDLDQIISWNYGGQSGLYHLIKYCCDSLVATKSEGFCLFIGPLILSLLIKNTEVMVPFLNDIIGPLANRLALASTDSMKQSIIIVIAQLCRTHLDVIIDFLSNPLPGIDNPLSLVLSTWLDSHDSFSGYFQIKLSAFALSLIFNKADPRIQNIQVKGKMIDINPGKIVTRSQTKAAGEQYTSLPASAKILSLLISDYRNDTYSIENCAPEDFDDDLSWADADEFDAADEAAISKLAHKDDAQGRFMLESNIYKLDSLYDFDLKAYVKELFASGIASNTGNLQQYFQYLEPLDQQLLHTLQ